MPVYRDRETQRVEKVNGGEGYMIRDRLLSKKRLPKLEVSVPIYPKSPLNPKAH